MNRASLRVEGSVRGVHRYNSFRYPQSGFCLVGKELKLSKVGCIRVKMHRPIEGDVKTCTLRKNTSGNWIVSFSLIRLKQKQKLSL
jgi:putative transposase